MYSIVFVFFCLFLQILFCYRFLQDCGFNSPCYTVNPCYLPIFCIVCNKFTVIKGKGEVQKEQIRSMGYKLTVLSELGFRSPADQGILSSDFVFLYFSGWVHCHSDFCHFLCQWQGVLWLCERTADRDDSPPFHSVCSSPCAPVSSRWGHLVPSSGFQLLAQLFSLPLPSPFWSWQPLEPGRWLIVFCIMSFGCNNFPSHKNFSYLNFPTVRALAKWGLISPEDLKTSCLLTILLKMLRKGDILISQ